MHRRRGDGGGSAPENDWGLDIIKEYVLKFVPDS
jgi:hypothetical protein